MTKHQVVCRFPKGKKMSRWTKQFESEDYFRALRYLEARALHFPSYWQWGIRELGDVKRVEL